MKIPFGMTLSGMLLKGKDRERAKIEYELNGEEKERALLALDYDTNELKKLKDYRIKKNELDKKYNKIGDKDYELEIARINIDNKSEKEVKIAELEVLHKYGDISNIEYYKQKNDLLGKPWVAINTNIESTDGDTLELEIAYNQTFIKRQKARGLPGDTDEEIAEQWLKLFFMANLDDDDIAMFEDSDEDSAPQLSIVSDTTNGKKFLG